MSVSTSSNPQDTARLVLEMDSNKSSSISQIDQNNNNNNDQNMEIDNNNDKIDPNLKFVDNENRQGLNKDDSNDDNENKKIDNQINNNDDKQNDDEIIDNKLNEKEIEKTEAEIATNQIQNENKNENEDENENENEINNKDNKDNKDSDGDQIMNDSNDNTNDNIKTKNESIKSDDEIKRSKIFYSNFKNLTDIVSDTLNEISIIIPKIYDQNSILNSYLCNIEKSDKIETFGDFMSGVEKFENDTKQLLNSNNKENKEDKDTKENNENNENNDNKDNNIKIERLSLHERARAARIFHEKNHPSCIEGTGVPEVDLNNQAKTVKDIWNEWNYGFKNRPSLQSLERKFGTRWRRGRIAKSAQRRKKVIEFIENEFKRHESILHDPLKVVDDLDNYRILKGKGLFWLYGSLPDRLYDDAGNYLYKNENDSNNPSNNIIKNNESKLNKIDDLKDSNQSKDSEENKNLKDEKISKDLKESEINKDGKVEKTEEEKEKEEEGEGKEKDNGAEKEIEKKVEDEKEKSDINEKEQSNNDKIDDNLKAIDSESIKETTNDSKKESTVDKKSNDEMEIDQDSNNSNEKSKSIPNEEEEEIEDMDEEEDDDVMPSVADVAAMASMSVEGEDDEHALVNSAALAVAAQHVANQQRLRDRQKSSTKSQNDNEEGDINNYISAEDSLNESTDPALSKL